MQQLGEKIKLKFSTSLTPSKKFHGFLNNDEFSSEHIYTALVDKPGGRFYGIRDEFFRRYEQFVCKDVLEIVKNELMEHIVKLKGMVG